MEEVGSNVSFWEIRGIVVLKLLLKLELVSSDWVGETRKAIMKLFVSIVLSAYR